MADRAATCHLLSTPGYRENMKQLLRYTVYRAISQSDDAKAEKDCSIPVVADSSNSSARSRSRGFTVRSSGKPNQAQTQLRVRQLSTTFQIQKALDEIVTEFQLLEEAIYFQINPFMNEPSGHPYFHVWHDAAVTVRSEVEPFQKKSKRFKTWKGLLQELEQKGWSTHRDIVCVTQIHNDVTLWAVRLESKFEERLLEMIYANLLYKCSRSIGKLTASSRDNPATIGVVNISPITEVKFQMRAIFWAVISICEKFDSDMLPEGDRDSGSSSSD